LYLYKLKKKLTLRGLVEDLSSSKVVKYLHLPRIPNFSTLSHFITALPSRIISAIDAAVQKILPSYEKVIVDSTGFECTHPSHYYCRRINTPFPVDGFITLHALIDQERGFIRTHKTRAKKVHDSKMLKPLVKKLRKKPSQLYADRGYDSEENARFLIEEIKCTPLILQKNMLKPLEKCKGENRRELRETFDYGEYLKRNKIEAIFSALKRKYGSCLSTRKVKTQEKELTLKIIIYNIEKMMKITITIILR
jgi:transposase